LSVVRIRALRLRVLEIHDHPPAFRRRARVTRNATRFTKHFGFTVEHVVTTVKRMIAP
jgi:hypothetical protein